MVVDQDVIEILADRLSYEYAGTARIEGALDRATYAKVNKVLVALGGKWSRSAKAHVFAYGNVRSAVERVVDAGCVTTAADLGFFETPPGLAQQLVELAGVEPGQRVLEPSAGTGRIVSALQHAGALVRAVEWDAGRRAHLRERVLVAGRDLLSDTADLMDLDAAEFPGEIDVAVMNPPFCEVGNGDHLDHVRRAVKLVAPGGVVVAVLPRGVAFRQDRRHAAFRAWVGERGTIADLPDDAFRGSGTMVRTVVVRLVVE